MIKRVKTIRVPCPRCGAKTIRSDGTWRWCAKSATCQYQEREAGS